MERDDALRPRSGTRAIIALLLGAALTTGVAACGFGTYDDSGKAVPGQWWPWVCPDGGTPSADDGCSPPPACSDLSAESCAADGGD